MYFKWMDGFPIIVSGCHEHNAEQLTWFDKLLRWFMK